MPIYEYKCNSCNTVFEEIQKFSDDPVKKCRHCSSTKVEKLISQSSFVLKGGGWYADGYSKKPKKKDSKPADTPAKPDCSTCPSSSSDN